MSDIKKNLPNVPYYSQWLDVKDPDWQRRSCGICALKMAMEFLKNTSNTSLRRPTSKLPDLDDLIKKGLQINNAYDPRFGWVHDGLVALAKSLGFESSFRKEWPIDGGLPAGEADPTSINESAENIVSILKDDLPVLASVKSDTGGHLILLIGFEKEGEKLKGFYYHDPDAKKADEGKNKFIPLANFLELWKGRIIVVKK